MHMGGLYRIYELRGGFEGPGKDIDLLLLW